MPGWGQIRRPSPRSAQERLSTYVEGIKVIGRVKETARAQLAAERNQEETDGTSHFFSSLSLSLSRLSSPSLTSIQRQRDSTGRGVRWKRER